MPDAPQLSFEDMYNYIMRNPELAQRFTPIQNAQQYMQQSAAQNTPQAQGRELGNITADAIAAADPLMQRKIMRMLGVPFSPQMRVNEDMGIAQSQPLKRLQKSGAISPRAMEKNGAQ